MRPLCQRLQHRGFNGDGRTDRASLQPLLVKIVTRRGFNGDGRYPARHFRVSLQRLLVPRSYQRHRRIRIRMSVATPTTRSKLPTTQTNIPTILLGRRSVVCCSVIATC